MSMLLCVSVMDLARDVKYARYACICGSAYLEENVLQPFNDPFVPRGVVVNASRFTFGQMLSQHHDEPLKTDTKTSIKPNHF